MNFIPLAIVGAVALFLAFPVDSSEAANIVLENRIIPIDSSIGLSKTVLIMNIPSSNTLPWAYVEGTIENYAEGYPVIIQIYQDDEPVYFAQTNVTEDGSYEHRFRVLSVDGNNVINIFEGDYTVKIFKVVYLLPSTDSV